MAWVKLSLLFFITLYGYGLSFSQGNQYKILSLEQGISNINALSVVRDDQGYIWIATELGLNRFSGNSFQHFYKSEQVDGSSVNSNEINKLLYANGLIYIGTRANGLNIFDTRTQQFAYYTHDPTNPHSIATNDITDLVKGKDNYLWLSTYHRGLQRFDSKTQTFVHFDTSTAPGLPSNSMWSVTQDQQGLLYCGHVNHGVSIFNPHSGEVINLHTGNTDGRLPHNEVKVLFRDSRNNIWIGTKSGLAVYHPSTKTLQKIPLRQHADKSGEPFVHAISEVGGQLWIGTEPSSIYMLTPQYASDNSLVHISQLQSFPIDDAISIQDITTDGFGNIWLALYGRGLGFISHFKPFFQTLPSLKSPINGIAVDVQNNIWFATEGAGLQKMSEKNAIKSNITLPDKMQASSFLSVYRDSHDYLWFGLPENGVARYHLPTQHWQHIGLSGELDEVRTILEDQKGKIWFGTKNGLVIYDPKTRTHDTLKIHQPALGDYAPRALVEDPEGNIWVGTYGQGIYVYSSVTRQLVGHFHTKNGLRSNSINHLHRDRDDHIWIATNEGIAVQYSQEPFGTLKAIVPPKPHAWLFIQAIIQDKYGDIWCSTKAGLLRYRPKENRFFSYDQDFGIPLGGFKNGSVAINNRHYLLFGMQEGICYFDPLNIPTELPLSPIQIRKFTTFQTGESPLEIDKPTYRLNALTLSYRENSFRVEFSPSDYAMDGLMEFRYQLKGFDEDWTDIGSEQALNFRNIPYGKYSLLIQARQKNEGWSDDIIQLPITITPPYYLSIYAKALYALLAGGIIFTLLFFYRRKIKAEGELRLKKLEHQQQQQLATERLHFFTNITHELRTPLTLILGPLDDILQEENLSTKQRNLVRVVQKSASRLFELVNQLLEFRKVESRHKPLVLGEGNLGEVVRELVHKYQELNIKNNLEIRCVLPNPDLRTTFDTEIIHIILDNLLSNAYKYTKDGSIEVHLTYEEDELNTWSILQVKDTGCGISAEYITRIYERFFRINSSSLHGTGVGLAIVKELVAVHYGKIDVESSPGKGTTFTVRLLTNRITPSAETEVHHADDVAQGEDETTQPVILLVEDDVDLRQYIASSLEVHYTLIIADHGAQGLELATKHIPDLIISDVMMAEMDGFEMVNKLKENRSTSHIPIILFTAKDQEIDRQHGYELGVESYLVKPIRPILLHKRIANILTNRAQLQHYALQQLPPSPQSPTPTNTEEANLWKENSFVHEFVAIVERHMQDDVLDAAKLAHKMNMSQSTLYRKLKALTGKNINQLVRKIRIQKAADLLQSGQYNVTEASFMVGIHSSIYFRQCFKEEFGILPSEYLKNAAERK